MTDYQNMEKQYNTDNDALTQALAQGNQALATALRYQVQFDNSVLQSLKVAMQQEGLGGSPDGTAFVPSQNTIYLIDVAPINAQAGQIFLYGGSFSGRGKLDAPTDINVDIENNTGATLQIEGIAIPQNAGGVHVQGALVTSDNAARLLPGFTFLETTLQAGGTSRT